MQVSNAIISVVAEVTLALMIGCVFLYIHARRLKSLIRRQQNKLLELLEAPAPSAPPPELSPTQHYKRYLNREIEATSSQFALLAPNKDIGAEELPQDLPQFERILALRYAFCARKNWVQQRIPAPKSTGIFLNRRSNPCWAATLMLIQTLQEELETANKRIENLEKFKRLFFDMEKQWNSAQANAQDYYAQLLALSEGVHDREGFNDVLQRYHSVYDDIHHNIVHITQNPDTVTEHKIINVMRQDPRAADEIMKLRNVAADQHRVINQLQRKLIEARTAEEKELVIQELQQQLQRQTRFVQESETCVQLLEEELSKAQQELTMKDKALNESLAIGEENERIKSTCTALPLKAKI